jgi:hypothetical protein
MGMSAITHRINVTLFRETEEGAESSQVESSGQYIT